MVLQWFFRTGVTLELGVQKPRPVTDAFWPVWGSWEEHRMARPNLRTTRTEAAHTEVPPTPHVLIISTRGLALTKFRHEEVV